MGRCEFEEYIRIKGFAHRNYLSIIQQFHSASSFFSFFFPHSISTQHLHSIQSTKPTFAAQLNNYAFYTLPRSHRYRSPYDRFRPSSHLRHSLHPQHHRPPRFQQRHLLPFKLRLRLLNQLLRRRHAIVGRSDP